MAKKVNPMLAKLQEKHELELRYQREFTIRQCRDMLAIAANEAYGFGEERLKRLLDKYDDVFLDYSMMAIEDSQADMDIIYTREKLDRNLQRIMGKYFEPWDDRYRINQITCLNHTFRRKDKA